MISVSEAKQIIANTCSALEPVTVSVGDAAGLVLSADVIAAYDIPAFAQSSMDGYAFRFSDFDAVETNAVETDLDKTNHKKSLIISGESAAGSSTVLELAPGAACRIFTGAPLPYGADTVIMQEKTVVSEGRIAITDSLIQKGSSVRLPGAEIRRGATALHAGEKLTPAAVSYLAAIGVSQVSVYPLPVVTIIITGNEFQLPGMQPAYGKVFEANSSGLSAVLKLLGISEATIQHSNDSLSETTTILNKALESSDLILITGGVSVGDYDFVIPAAVACGVEKLFHKVKQKPGKPLFFGRKAGKTVFGLPGNPSSVLTCFYEYVLPAIGQLCRQDFSLVSKQVRLKESVNKPVGLTHFMKAVFLNDEVSISSAQESFRLSSFARANCLVVLPEESNGVTEGEMVEVHLLG